jgi:4'-phosphopantetheinyl transferase
MDSTLIKYNAITLYHGELAISETNFNKAFPYLNHDEKNKTEAFSREEKKFAYAETHALLRLTISQLVYQSPADIRIAKSDYGKPYLVDYPDLSFNLSHSKHCLAIAVGYQCQLGVDIEYCRSRPNLPALVDKCLSFEEKAHWLTLSDPAKQEFFYRIWTLKEAFAKATGRGIAVGLKRCVFEPTTLATMLSLPKEFGLPEDWQILHLNIATSMAGAILLRPSSVNTEPYSLIQHSIKL